MTLLATTAPGRSVPSRPGPRRLGLAGLASLLLQTVPALAQSLDNYQVVGSTAAYLGVVPSEIVQGHSINHPEARMHGGPPGGHSEHLVVALFESPSGRRIEDARVSATIVGHGGLNPVTIDLESMLIAGVVTFGGFLAFAAGESTEIDLMIRRPSGAEPTLITFVYEHGTT